jgi:putative transposase
VVAVSFFYDKCYFTLKNELINKKPFSIKNDELLKNVKNDEYYFEDKNINYKDKIVDEFEIKIKSDQTLFKDVVYKFSLGDNKIKLPADIILNIINKYYESIKSYYAIIKINKKARKPKFLDKNAKFNLYYFTSSFKQEKNKIRLTIGEYHSDNYNNFQKNKLQKINNRKYYCKTKVVKTIKKGKRKLFEKVENGFVNKKNIIDAYYLYFTLPNKFKNENIKMVEVKSYGNKVFLNIIYEKTIDIKVKNPKISIKNSISMDPGIKNLLTIYNPTGEQHIISGLVLKSINEFYNKKISELQSINKMKLNKHTFNRLYSLLQERNNKINAEINKIIDLLIKTYSDKRYFIIGYNENWKQKVNLGNKTNRIFYGIPYNRIIFKLKSKLEDLGKSLIIKEESYTSKCDSLNLEDVKKQENYDGKRINRGLFISKTGLAINADLNGAINIMRKVIDLKEIVGKKLFNPTRLVHN